MDNFKEKQPSVPEKGIGKPEERESQQEQLEESVIRDIADDKRAADSTIESEAKAVQDIFGSLERRTTGEQEIQGERAINNPEEILDKVKDGLSKIENPTIDDISRVLITFGLEMQDIQSWLTANKSEIQAFASSKEKLEIRGNELSGQMTQEAQKSFFAKLFRGKERKAIADQLREVSDQIAQIVTPIGERQSRGEQIESVMQELASRQEELALNATEQLFQSVVEKHQQLKEKLFSPQVKQELNTDLIARRVLPELERLRQERKITKNDADEYLGLLRAQLDEGSQSDWNDPIEKKESINAKRKRLDELDRKSEYNLRNINYRVSNRGEEPADTHYDRIFDFLLREATKEKIEQLRDSLGGLISQELQARVAKITKGIIYPVSDWRAPRSEIKESLDLSKLPIEKFKELDGLERWQIVKKFAESSGFIPKETFERVEKIIIQRLFNEQLFPGGYESWAGTAAADKMGDLGNPEALPLMLRHIEASGSGHTNNAVVYAMESLLKESDPEALQRTLEALPKNKRLLLQTLADENSYMSRFGRINSRYYTCTLLQHGDLTLAREKLTRILENSTTLEEDKLEKFYCYGEGGDVPEFLQPLLKSRDEVERTIIESKLSIWIQSSEKLLAALVNPKHGESVAFPRRIAREGLGLTDEKLLGNLEHIFSSKTFKEGGFERERFVAGLVLLNSKENGRLVLETILGAYRGTKDDPKRARRILQLLGTLDGFGAYEFVTPLAEGTAKLRAELSALQGQLKETKEKDEKKAIKNKIEATEIRLNNLTGLKGIEEVMVQKIVEVACQKLDLPAEYEGKIKENLDKLLKSGVFEIVPSLAGKYDSKNEVEVKNLLKTITMHIIEGDFHSWRYSHEKSQTQLEGLTDEQKEKWQSNLEPITIDIEISEEARGRRTQELKAVQEIIKNAKEHILTSSPNFEFSRSRMQSLNTQIEQLTNKIKSTTTEDEKKQLGANKKKLEAELAIISGILEIEEADPRTYTRDKIFSQARELGLKITQLNIPLAGLDIEQIGKIFTVGDIKNIVASESDDPLTLLKVGVEPQETCQSWRGGGFNECLLAYVADSNKKIVNVADAEGQILARSVIKLTDQREAGDSESKTKRKTILVEKPYSLLQNKEIFQAFIRLLLTKANEMGVSITFSSALSEELLGIFKKEAEDFGFTSQKGDLELFLPPSLNKYEYSDTLGGKISWFDRYQPLDAVTFEKRKI